MEVSCESPIMIGNYGAEFASPKMVCESKPAEMFGASIVSSDMVWYDLALGIINVSASCT